MTEPVVKTGGAADVEREPYSKDYWDNVFEQIGRRPLVKLALVILAILYGSAIYAPLIANDRPFVLEAVDKQAYDDARRGLVGVTTSLRDLIESGREAYEAALRERGQDQTYATALEAERGALRLRLATMRSYLPSNDHADLDVFQRAFESLVDEGLAGERPLDEVVALRDEAKDLRKRYEPATEEGGEGRVLAEVRSYPLWESTTSLEVFFMVLWVFVLAWPLWNRLVNRLLLRGVRTRIRGARRAKFGLVFGVSLSAALVWAFTIGGSMTFDVATYKDLLTSGRIEASKAVFPPLNLGFAESHPGEPYREPTWLDESEIDEEGYYVRGPKVMQPDPLTGQIPKRRPVEVRYGEPERNATWRHFLGTDILGRDLFVRLLYGGRISLSVGILSTLMLVFIGVVIGSIAGYVGGLTDILLSRIIEIVQSIPAFFLILTCVAIIPEKQLPPIFTIVVFIALVRWTGVARLVRGEFLKLKEQEFVLAARAGGFSNARIIFRHVLPNALGPVLVAAAFSVAAGILTESSLSFLGFGIKYPIPSWGSLINESRAAEHWWIQVFPGFLIFLTVFCYNLVGEGVRDALDPRMKVLG